MIVSRFHPKGESFAGVAMRIIMLAGALIGLFIVANISPRLPSEHHEETTAQQHDVDERFAVKYCYRQYRDQRDIDSCVLRNANLAAAHNRWETRHLGATAQ